MSKYYNRSTFRYGLSEAFKKKIKEKFTKKKDIIKKSDEKRFDAEYKKNMNALRAANQGAYNEYKSTVRDVTKLKKQRGYGTREDEEKIKAASERFNKEAIKIPKKEMYDNLPDQRLRARPIPGPKRKLVKDEANFMRRQDILKKDIDKKLKGN